MNTEQTHPTTTDEPTTGSTVIETQTGDLLAKTQAAIYRLESDDATPEDFLIARQTYQGLKTLTDAYRAMLAVSAVDYINNHGEVETPTERFYVGNKTTTKCRDKHRAVEAVLTETGGDLDALCEALSPNPLKPGACKTILGDDWHRYFMVETTQDIKTGKPTKELKRIDKRFTKGT